MKKKLFWIQSLVLFAGTIFAWVTVYFDFKRFYQFEGTIFKIQDCILPNPVVTPCFWGAFGFLFSFLYSLWILRRGGIKFHQNILYFIVLGCTIFAWSNFTFTLYKFFASPGPSKGCSGIIVFNPFATPCFYGSMIFLTALVVAFFTLASISKKDKETSSQE